MADVSFAVDVHCKSHSCATAQARGFSFNIDEPEQLGGSNTGPNPVEYVIGAYAGCLNVVGHMVAKEMGFDIEDMKIHVEGDLDPDGFMGKNPNVRAGYKQIRVDLDLQADIDDETLNEWLNKISTRCPVGDNLKNPTPITTAARVRQTA